MPGPFRIEALTKAHDRAAFSCEQPSLTDYLRRYAAQDMSRAAARCYVMLEGQRVIGYYTLSNNSQPTSFVPSGKPRKPCYGEIPGILLGRLARDIAYRGQNIGRLLLIDAMTRALRASEISAAWALYVEAIDQKAANFYARFDFLPLLDDPRHLFLPMETIRKALA